MLKQKTSSDYSDFKKKFLFKKSQMMTMNLFSATTKKCIFCDRCPKSKDFLIMINKALYVKFAASQNYYYSKDINEILSDSRNKIAINFKDQSTYDETEEYLKRSYLSKEIKGKLIILTEYYKFHKDVPRIFMYSIAKIMNNYHDKKRKIEYVRITKIIKEKNEGKLKKEKEKDLNKGCLIEEKIEKIFPNPPLKNNFIKILDDDLTEEKHFNKNLDISSTSTVIELQKKLGDIINEKLSRELKMEELYTSKESFSNFFDNSSFVKYMSNLEAAKDKFKSKINNKIKKPSKVNTEKENAIVFFIIILKKNN